MNELIPATPAALAALEVAQRYAKLSMSDATMRAYKSDWKRFVAWCDTKGVLPLPADPGMVGAFIAAMAETHAPNSIRRCLVSISIIHKLNKFDWRPDHPEITAPLKGLLRTHGRPAKKAEAIGLDIVRALVATCADTPAGMRDRCMLILGFGGAFRRSELVALRVENIRIEAEGLRVLIPRSKTDQEGQGREVGLPAGAHAETCPVRALAAWLALLGVKHGPLFRRVSARGTIGRNALSPCAVWDILERRSALAGLESTPRPHGLRAGFVTTAYNAGARDEQIMQHTGHRDLKTMRGYVRRAKLLSASPAGLVGL